MLDAALAVLLCMEPMTPSMPQFQSLCAEYPMLRFLVLFGSRARGDAREDSDWDFGFVGDLDPATLLKDLVILLGTEQVDVVDLSVAGGLLRFRAAVDGVALCDRDGAWDRFRLEAANFWCDVEPILRAAYNDVVKAVG